MVWKNQNKVPMSRMIVQDPTSTTPLYVTFFQQYNKPMYLVSSMYDCRTYKSVHVDFCIPKLNTTYRVPYILTYVYGICIEIEKAIGHDFSMGASLMTTSRH